MKRNRRTIYDCDRCKFTFKKIDLRKQRGMLLCDGCFDTTLEIQPVNIKWRSPRSNGTSISSDTQPITFTITTAGITALSKSQTFTREGVTNDYVMNIVGLPTTITANPQITSGLQGTYLTIVGTDDTNSVTFQTGNGTDLQNPFTLKKGNVLSLVYNATAGLWCETSRYTGGSYGT